MKNNMEHDVHYSDEEMLDDVPEILVVVENDEDSRGLVVSGLRDVCRVIEADNGNDGLKMAFEQTPDLIATDIMMPGMSGIELCRELKTNMMTAHIPVIILTAQAAVESQVEGLKAGADFYVTKPFLATTITKSPQRQLHLPVDDNYSIRSFGVFFMCCLWGRSPLSSSP